MRRYIGYFLEGAPTHSHTHQHTHAHHFSISQIISTNIIALPLTSVSHFEFRLFVLTLLSTFNSILMLICVENYFKRKFHRKYKYERFHFGTNTFWILRPLKSAKQKKNVVDNLHGEWFAISVHNKLAIWQQCNGMEIRLLMYDGFSNNV